MRPVEWFEQIVMVLVIIAWAGWFWLISVYGIIASPPWLYKLMYYGTPIPVLIILANRLLRYRAAIRDAEALSEQRGKIDGSYRLK
ncbi:MAG: hypothetical protein ACUVX8_15475 [Candidatus Zipacnadales bacterium]